MQQKYPAKNRPAASGLNFLEIEVISGRGREVFNPVSIILAAKEGRFEGIPPIAGLPSDLSKAPAISYRTEQVQLNLTPAEFRRLVMRNLTPDEFFALANRYGVFYEICFDFYNPETGVAGQSKE
jgi:hypothetical protein